jgi:hypothetical protein
MAQRKTWEEDFEEEPLYRNSLTEELREEIYHLYKVYRFDSDQSDLYLNT